MTVCFSLGRICWDERKPQGGVKLPHWFPFVIRVIHLLASALAEERSGLTADAFLEVTTFQQVPEVRGRHQRRVFDPV